MSLNHDLTLDAGEVTVSIEAAARHLRVSRSRIAEYILDGQLTLTSDKRLALADVDRISTRSPAEPQRLARVLDAVLWFMRDWGGASRPTELAFALKATRPGMGRALAELKQLGYVTTQPGARGHYVLTDLAREYLTKVERPM